MDCRELTVGQVWKNKRTKPTQLAIINYCYTKSGTKIKNHEYWESPRVVFAIVDDEGIRLDLRDLHEHSFRLMYPHIAFDLTLPIVEEDK